MKETFPTWWPQKKPIYDIERSYLENAEEGPFFDGPLPKRLFPAKEQWIDFLGVSVASPIGVPAGPLLNGRWVHFAATMGFDIVTYKTIRSRMHPAHPLPNMIYVETKGALTPQRQQETLSRAQRPPLRMSELAVTNSFGIPSREEAFLLEDIEKTNRLLAPGQVMIVSVVGTPRPNEDYLEDFVTAASLAKQAGAKIIELDLSCPNIAACEGSLFTNIEALATISRRTKKTIGETPLIIKVGVVPTVKMLKEILCTAATVGVEAVCGINTVSMKVVDAKGEPALGVNRLTAGVCGGPIRAAALDFIRQSAQINCEEKLGLTLMATGGVTEPVHFDDFFEAGAHVAMSAVGMMWDPYLAMRYHTKEKV